jgi:hypothetical protein
MYAIDKEKTFDLVGSSGDHEFDVGIHADTRTVHVARSASGTIKLGAWTLGSDGSFTGGPADVVVGQGSRTRIIVFDNHRIVVFWLDSSSALRMRGYNSGGANPGNQKTIATAIADFDVVDLGITTGVQHGGQGVVVHYAYRQFALTAQGTGGSWTLYFGAVDDSGDVTIDSHASGGSGDKVVLSCASENESFDGTHPRKALTLWRDAAQGLIRTRTWRLAEAAVTPLMAAAETKPLGVGIVHGMSIAPGTDVFAAVVWPGSSNNTSRLQLVSLAADGTMNVYANTEFPENPRSFARLQTDGLDAGVAYVTPDGHLAVAAWRFAAPGSGNAARSVFAAKTGTEQPTQVRLASLIPPSDSDADPVWLVTLDRVAAGALRLVSWKLHQTLVYGPVGSNPIGIATKP